MGLNYTEYNTRKFQYYYNSAQLTFEKGKILPSKITDKLQNKTDEWYLCKLLKWLSC